MTWICLRRTKSVAWFGESESLGKEVIGPLPRFQLKIKGILRMRNIPGVAEKVCCRSETNSLRHREDAEQARKKGEREEEKGQMEERSRNRAKRTGSQNGCVISVKLWEGGGRSGLERFRGDMPARMTV